MKTNPKALAAALQVIKETMQPWTTANGRLPAPRAAQGGTSQRGPAPKAGGNAKHYVGEPVTLKNGQQIIVKKVYPDGSFE
jgi:hypothetical protein